MKEYIERIKEDSVGLSPCKLILLCNLNCERMLAAYEIFTKLDKFGNYNFMSELIVRIYNDVMNGCDIEFYKRVNNEIENETPDLDNFQSDAASYAFDFCIAIEQTILFIISNKVEHVKWNIETSFNTVDMFIQHKENIGTLDLIGLIALEKLIDEHQYMQREIQRQTRLVNHLKNLTSVNEEDITFLRNLNENFGKQIDHSLLFSL